MYLFRGIIHKISDLSQTFERKRKLTILNRLVTMPYLDVVCHSRKLKSNSSDFELCILQTVKLSSILNIVHFLVNRIAFLPYACLYKLIFKIVSHWTYNFVSVSVEYIICISFLFSEGLYSVIFKQQDLMSVTSCHNQSTLIGFGSYDQKKALHIIIVHQYECMI